MTALLITVDEDIAAALEGVTLRPDSVALGKVMRHAVLTISHELGDIAEGADDIHVDELRRLATQLDRLADALEAMDIDDAVGVDQEGRA